MNSIWLAKWPLCLVLPSTTPTVQDYPLPYSCSTGTWSAQCDLAFEWYQSQSLIGGRFLWTPMVPSNYATANISPATQAGVIICKVTAFTLDGYVNSVWAPYRLVNDPA